MRLIFVSGILFTSLLAVSCLKRDYNKAETKTAIDTHGSASNPQETEASNPINCAMSLGSFDEIEKMTLGPVENGVRYLRVHTQEETFLNACQEATNTIDCKWKLNKTDYAMSVGLPFKKEKTFDDRFEWRSTAKVESARDGLFGSKKASGEARCLVGNQIDNQPDEGRVYVTDAIACAAAIGEYNEVEKMLLSPKSSNGTSDLLINGSGNSYTYKGACKDIGFEIACEWQQSNLIYKLSIDPNFEVAEGVTRTKAKVKKSGGKNWLVTCRTTR